MIRDLVGQVNGNLPLFDIQTQTEQVAKTLYQERLRVSISSFFALVALTLSGLGLYGLLSYGVSLRVHEIGVRKALGAPSTAVLREVVSESVVLTMIGIIAGSAGSFPLTRLISSILFEVSPQDPLTLIATSILLILVALIACFVPALRASRLIRCPFCETSNPSAYRRLNRHYFRGETVSAKASCNPSRIL